VTGYSRRAALTAAVAGLTLAVAPRRGGAASPLRIAALGDSLTAGYGLPATAAFPPRLEAALQAEGRAVRVSNAGVSGDTTADGLARLGWMLADRPDRAIVELGANDALRGLDPKLAEANLTTILTRLKEAGIPVLLAGMLAPPNYGRAYESAFNAIYPRLAQTHQVALYPFFLDGVAGHPDLNQPDGLHPTAAGVETIVARILPSVRTLLDHPPAPVQAGGR